MSNGGYKGASPARETSPEQYPGVWELTEQFQAQADGNWPFQAADCAPKSLRFNSGDSASYLNRTPSSAGNRKQFTFSCWVKLGTLGTERIIFHTANSWFRFNTGDPIYYYWSGSDAVYTNALFRDPSAWYHLVLAVDTTQATASNRVKIYVNGVQQAVSGTQPNQNSDLDINNNVAHYIGRQSSNTSNMFDGYLADVHFIDGQQLAPTDFGFYDGAGIWQPKRFTGDYSSGPVYSNNSTGDPFNGTGNWGQAFDGSLSTGPFTYNYNSSGDNTLTLPAGVTWSSKIRVYVIRYDGVFEINGTDVSTGIGNTAAWHDLTSTLGSSGTLSTIKIGDVGTNYVKLYAVELDDVILTNASVGRNSFHLDFSDFSSNAAVGKDSSGLGNNFSVNNIIANAVDYVSSTTGTLFSGSWSQAFNGSTSTPAPYIYETTSSITFPTAISGVIELNVSLPGTYRNNPTVYTLSNGATYSKSTTAQEWISFGSQSNVTSISVNGPDPGTYVFAVRLDGNILVSALPSETDCLLDSPVNGNEASTGAGGERRGNYCVLNPLDKRDSPTYSNGNLQVNGSGAAHCVGRSTFGVSSGKWYWEATINSAIVSTYYPSPGICSMDTVVPNQLGDGTSGYAYMADGQKYTSATLSSYGDSFAQNDIIGFALDMDAGTLVAYKNGTSQGTLATGLTGSWSPSWNHYLSTSLIYNFGQRPFHTAAPAGFSPLATSFLPEPTIKRGDEAMDAKLYTGNGSTQSITGYGFSPDWVWVKRRNSSGDHQLYDIVRGANKGLSANLTSAEWTYSGGLSSFDSDGFSVGSLGGLNANNDTHVAWAWDAGDATTTIAAGSLNSSAYNTSQTWSDNIVTTGNSGNWSTTAGIAKDKAFNGNDSNYAHANADGSAVAVVTLTFSPALACNQTVSFLGGVTSSGTGEIKINGGTATNLVVGGSNPTANDKTTVNFTGNITTITITKTSTSAEGLLIYGFEVDGARLVDNGTSGLPNAPSIASTVRANPSAGFSVVKWSNPSSSVNLGHGLNATPSFILTKGLGSCEWQVYHVGIGNAYKLYLDSTSAQVSSSAWNSTTPTSTVFEFNDNRTQDFVAYCFAPVEFYSAFGSFEGTGSGATGPFVNVGFKIAWLLLKNADASGDWVIYDAKRIGYNPKNYHLHPNNSNAGSDSEEIDLLSNGFKLRSGQAHINGSGNTIIYAAFASNPFSSNCRAR